MNAPDRRRTVVLDDDPTGTQASADVAVVLDPAIDLAPVLMNEDAFHLLTNTRSLDEDRAIELLAELKRRLDGDATRLGLQIEYVLRGDSTLRGHVFAESDLFGARDGVLLFVPAFPAAGRVTEAAIHYVETAGERQVAADTEFARDPVFGYRSRNLTDWVGEKGNRPARSVPVDPADPDRAVDDVAAALLEAPDGSVVVPDISGDDDLQRVSRALDIARAGGRSIAVRSAAPFAAIRTGRLATGAPVDEPEHDPAAEVARPCGALVVCGSHTLASTEQLSALADHWGLPVRTVDTRAALDSADDEARLLAGQLGDDLDSHGVALIATERVRRAEHATLEHGAAVMRALCGSITHVRGSVGRMIAKGGITSADALRFGIGATQARVRGPIATGIGLWEVPMAGGNTICAVVPGNVGTRSTLIDVADRLGIEPRN